MQFDRHRRTPCHWVAKTINSLSFDRKNTVRGVQKDLPSVKQHDQYRSEHLLTSAFTRWGGRGRRIEPARSDRRLFSTPPTTNSPATEAILGKFEGFWGGVLRCQELPTVGLLDGTFRANVKEPGIGYANDDDDDDDEFILDDAGA